MADIHEHADALRWYLTGAASDGGAQSSPHASLGKYRSSTRLDVLGIEVSGGPSNLTYVLASGECGTGTAYCQAVDAGTLRWKAPGGSYGASAGIGNGETKQLVDGGSWSKILLVTRDSADDLTGTATLALDDVFNNMWDNVATAEATAGDTEIRCFCLKNHASSEVKAIKFWLAALGTDATVDASGYAASGGVIITAKSGTDFDDWPDAGIVQNVDTGEALYYSSRTNAALTVPAGGHDVWGDGAGTGSEDDVLRAIPPIRIGVEAPSAQPDGSFTDKTAGEGEAVPVSVYHPVAEDDVTVVTVPDLAAGYIYGLWLERKILTSSTALASVLDLIEVTYEAI